MGPMRSDAGRGPVLILDTDCPLCQSAGSVRRGRCDVCGGRLNQPEPLALAEKWQLVLA